MSKYKKEFNFDETKGVVKAVYKVNSEDSAKLLENSVDYFAKNAKLPGFRKGKAPKEAVLQNYFNEIHSRFNNLLLDEILQDLVETAEHKPDTNKQVKVLDMKNITDDDKSNQSGTKAQKKDKQKQKKNQGIEVHLEYQVAEKIVIAEPANIQIKTKLNEANDQDLKNFSVETLKNIYKQNLGKELELKDDEKENLEIIYNKVFKEEAIQKANPTIKDFESLKKELQKVYTEHRKTQFVNTWINELYDNLINKSQLRDIKIHVEEELENRLNKYKKRFTKIGIDAEQYYKEHHNISLNDLKEEWRTEVQGIYFKQEYLVQFAATKKIKISESEISSYIRQNKDQLLDGNPSNDFQKNQRMAQIMLAIYKAEHKVLTQALENSSLTEEEKKLIQQPINNIKKEIEKYS